MENNSLLRPAAVVALVTVLLLMIPLVAMQFTDDVVWTLSDFIIMGLILFGAGFTYVLISRMSANTTYRAAVAFAVFAGLLLVWVNLAVGIIGDKGHLVNGLFFFVPLIALFGALGVRFRADGAARSTAFAGIIQVLIPLVAWVVGIGSGYEFVLTNFLAVLWLISARLFLKVAQDEARLQADVHAVEILKPSVTSYLVAFSLIAVGVVVGVGGVSLAEADDAPGAALIGIAVLIGAVVLGFRTLRRSAYQRQ